MQLILPAEIKHWHLIGRGGRFLKPMLVRNPSVCVRFQDTPTIPSHGEVRITGMPGEAVNVHFDSRQRAACSPLPRKSKTLPGACLACELRDAMNL